MFSSVLWTVERMVAFLLAMVPVLLAMAYFTLAERKRRSAMQRRQGPNLVGVYGLTQPLADGLKLFLKEFMLPSSANARRFVMAPRVLFSLRLVSWVVVPRGRGRVLADVNLGILYLFAMSALSVYGMRRAGWASNSKYAFLGALRSAAQRVSYEVSMGFMRVTVLLCVGSLNLTEVVLAQRAVWYAMPLLPSFLLFFMSAVAETNRHPFDLPEAEAELVSGYNVEYSGRGFALFFLGETGNRLVRCSTRTMLFLGGWLPPRDRAPFNWVPGPLWFSLKRVFFMTLFVWLRAAYPRYRYDQLRRLGWKVLLPTSLGWLVLTAGMLRGFDGLSQ